MSQTDQDRGAAGDGSGEREIEVYQSILDTLSGPRVVYRDGEASVDMSSYDRPFAPAVAQGAEGTLLARRR